MQPAARGPAISQGAAGAPPSAGDLRRHSPELIPHLEPGLPQTFIGRCKQFGTVLAFCSESSRAGVQNASRRVMLPSESVRSRQRRIASSHGGSPESTSDSFERMTGATASPAGSKYSSPSLIRRRSSSGLVPETMRLRKVAHQTRQSRDRAAPVASGVRIRSKNNLAPAGASALPEPNPQKR